MESKILRNISEKLIQKLEKLSFEELEKLITTLKDSLLIRLYKDIKFPEKSEIYQKLISSDTSLPYYSIIKDFIRPEMNPRTVVEIYLQKTQQLSIINNGFKCYGDYIKPELVKVTITTTYFYTHEDFLNLDADDTFFKEAALNEMSQELSFFGNDDNFKFQIER
jgi:hypothetical protein